MFDILKKMGTYCIDIQVQELFEVCKNNDTYKVTRTL